MPPSIVALSPGDLGPGDEAEFLKRLRAALAGGLEGVLLRERRLPDAAFVRLSAAAAKLVAARGGWFAVHDRAHVAASANAQAVHLGFRSLMPADARRVVGAETALGLSTHADDACEHWEGADYLFHGPVFDTPSKRGLVAPIGAAGLASGVARAKVPVLAIGGLTPEHAPLVRAAGATGMAVLRGLLGAVDPGAAAASFRAAWSAAA